MIKNDYEWKTTYHKDAATTQNIALCRDLYEERIHTLEDYISALEADILLLRMEAAADGE